MGFTVLSMSLSLVAVFLPLLLMGGLPGRLLREFAVTLSVAIGISLAVSLTLTPMMCGWLLKSGKPHQPTRNRGFGRLLVAVQGGYGKSLKWVLKHSRLTGWWCWAPSPSASGSTFRSRKPSSRNRTPGC